MTKASQGVNDMEGTDSLAPLPGWRGGDANAAYLDKTLRHEYLDIVFDERVRLRELLRLWAKAFLASLLFLLLPAPLVLVSALQSGDSGALNSLLFLGNVVFLVVLLFSRTTEPIGEWRVLLMDRRDRAADVYSQIRGTLRQRQSPLQVYDHRLWLPGRLGSNDRLRISEGRYQTYVSVFPYGTSLYLGWTMWRSRRGYALVGRFIADIFRSIAGQNGDEAQVMRSERPRAMREAVHLACREGLYVGLENRSVAEAFGFPAGLPEIQDSLLPEPAAPQAVPPQPHMPPQGPPTAPPWTGSGA